MNWGDAFPSLLVAAAWLIGPGLVITAPFRLGLLARAAISGPVGVCAVVAAATLFGAFGLPLRWWQVLIVTAIGLMLTVSVRPAVPRLEPRPDRRSLLLVGMWLLSVLAAAIVTFARVPLPDRISQTQDAVYHLAATAAVLDGHSASPFALGGLTSTAGGISYSPSAWHTLAALVVQTSPASVPVAFNVLWLAMIAVVWLPGIAWLARTLVPTWAAAAVALPLGVSFGWFPYALLTWGTLYTTAIATALLPAAVSVTLFSARAVLGDGERGSKARRWTAAIIGVALAGGALIAADPGTVASLFVIVSPFVVWKLAAKVRREREIGGHAAARAVLELWGSLAAAVVIVASSLAYARFADPLTGPSSPALENVPQTIGEGIIQVVMAQSMTGVNGIVTIVAPPLALAIIGGVFLGLRRSSTRWIVVSYALLAVLYVVAAGPETIVSTVLTDLWRGDSYRLAAALAVMALPLAVIGIVTLGRLIMPARRSLGAAAAVAVSVIVGVTSTGTLAASGVTESVGAVFRQHVQSSEGAVVSSAQMTFMREKVSAIVPEDQRVLGDPWDGSALSGLYAGREPVFPYTNGVWDDDRALLARSLQAIDDDTAVCRALDELRVRYVLYNAGGHAVDTADDRFPGPHLAVEAGLFERVASDGESALYRIDQCGELP